MKKKLSGPELFDNFQGTIHKAKEIQHEWERLNSIEERLEGDLHTLKQEVAGLDRANGMSSLTSEALRVIREQLDIKKRSANGICRWLGISAVYPEMERRIVTANIIPTKPYKYD